MRPSRLLSAALAALTALVVAGGCGGSETASQVRELASLVGVADATARASSVAFELELELTVPDPDVKGPISFTGSGAFDTSARRGHMELDLSSMARAAAAAGEALGDPSDWRVELVADGDTAYVRFPLLAEGLPAGKTWVKGTAAELAGQGGLDLGPLGPAAGSDPRALLEFLRVVAAPITVEGQEDVRGTQTTHYRGLLDVRKALEEAMKQSLPDGQTDAGAGLDLFDGLLDGLGLSSVPVDVWVDGDQLLRRLQVGLTMQPPGESEAMTIELSLELFDYGEPVRVDVPPADQVADASALGKGFALAPTPAG